MKKEKGLIIAVMVLFLVSGVAACIFRQYRDGQEKEPAPVYVSQDRESQPQTIEKPEETPEQKSEEVPVQEAESVQPEPENGTEQTETEQTETEQTETEQAETEQPETVYYAFTVRGDISSLNLRKVPDMDGKVLGRLMPKQTGYVLEYGEEWSLVTTGKKSGYVNNRYIELEEISEEDFPAEYRD